MFELSKISFTYPNGDPISFPEMIFKPGEEWVIIGPSGCGKTTLLHLMAGLLNNYDGSIKLHSKEFKTLSHYKMDKFRGKHIGIVFQSAHLIKSLTALENVVLAQSLGNRKKDKQQAKELLISLGIGHRLNHTPSKMSLGEQQRVAIARALVNNPDIILADEPTSALDDENAEKVLEVLRSESKKRNSTLIIVTHDQRLKDKVANKIELGHA